MLRLFDFIKLCNLTDYIFADCNKTEWCSQGRCQGEGRGCSSPFPVREGLPSVG